MSHEVRLFYCSYKSTRKWMFNDTRATNNTILSIWQLPCRAGDVLVHDASLGLQFKGTLHIAAVNGKGTIVCRRVTSSRHFYVCSEISQCECGLTVTIVGRLHVFINICWLPSLLARLHKIDVTDFDESFIQSVSWLRLKLIRFWWPKVKGQSNSKVKTLVLFMIKMTF